MNNARPASLEQAIAEFVGAFQVVFHYDWNYTTTMIGQEAPSFLSPGLSTDEETEDWGSRGALLEKYRQLAAAMKAAGISPAFPFPLESLQDVLPPLD